MKDRGLWEEWVYHLHIVRRFHLSVLILEWVALTELTTYTWLGTWILVLATAAGRQAPLSINVDNIFTQLGWQMEKPPTYVDSCFPLQDSPRFSGYHEWAIRDLCQQTKGKLMGQPHHRCYSQDDDNHVSMNMIITLLKEMHYKEYIDLFFPSENFVSQIKDWCHMSSIKHLVQYHKHPIRHSLSALFYFSKLVHHPIMYDTKTVPGSTGHNLP